ncbi:hypothetical protein G9A89_001567 [Geosiphon pyriformis]|nr:hypothetical protein G9A89_001567 [Geosiphon pyriformis]
MCLCYMAILVSAKFKKFSFSLYQDFDYGGKHWSYTFDINKCVNVPSYFNDITSSVKTEKCIWLYRDYDCQGPKHRVCPDGEPRLLDFNDRASSVSTRKYVKK